MRKNARFSRTLISNCSLGNSIFLTMTVLSCISEGFFFSSEHCTPFPAIFLSSLNALRVFSVARFCLGRMIFFRSWDYFVGAVLGAVDRSHFDWYQ
ncbi:hypothetical protein X975_05013, partial [Stegodyphus mimosarum]